MRRTVFYRERAFTQDDFKKFMFEQSQPFPKSLEFLGQPRQTAALRDGDAQQRVARNQRVPHTDIPACGSISARFSARATWACESRSREIYSLALQITQCDPRSAP